VAGSLYAGQRRRSPYPEPVVIFTEFLIQDLPNGLNNEFVRCRHLIKDSGLAVVFRALASSVERVEYSSILIDFVGRLYEEVCYASVNLEHANRLAISMLDLGDCYFRQADAEGKTWLKSTKRFERECGTRALIKQSASYKSASRFGDFG
jgi:hypothetical protein